MKDYFTEENTIGFEELDLEAMNEHCNRAISDPDDEEEVKSVCDRANNHCNSIIAMYASEKGINLPENYFD